MISNNVTEIRRKCFSMVGDIPPKLSAHNETCFTTTTNGVDKQYHASTGPECLFRLGPILDRCYALPEAAKIYSPLNTDPGYTWGPYFSSLCMQMS